MRIPVRLGIAAVGLSIVGYAAYIGSSSDGIGFYDVENYLLITGYYIENTRKNDAELDRDPPITFDGMIRASKKEELFSPVPARVRDSMVDFQCDREKGKLIAKISKSGDFENDLLLSFYPIDDPRSSRHTPLSLGSSSGC